MPALFNFNAIRHAIAAAHGLHRVFQGFRNAAFNSADAVHGPAFFESVEFHFEMPDFAIPPIWFAVCGYRLRTPMAFKQGLGLHMDFLLPLSNLRRVKPELLTNLVDGLAPVGPPVRPSP